MKNKMLVGLAILLLLACARIGFSQQSKVSPELWRTAQTQGVVRVSVGLNVPWQPEGKLSPQDRVAQREAIATAQDQLLAELTGTNYRVIGRYRSIPGIGLEVGPDALAILEQSARVTDVTEDRPVGLQ